MAVKKTNGTLLLKSLTQRSRSSSEAAIREIKELRKDLTALERALTAKSPKADFPLLDIVHGAFEIYRHAVIALDGQALAFDMEKEMGDALAVDYLEKAGASLLKKPAGWHWISPAGEMHFLGVQDEAEKAATALKKLRAPGKKKAAPKKAASKTVAGKPAEEAAAE